jgi:hypothetical protein
MAERMLPCPKCNRQPELNGYGYYHLGTEYHDIKCANSECDSKLCASRTQHQENDFDLVDRWNKLVGAQIIA